MAGNVHMATLEPQKSSVCLQASWVEVRIFVPLLRGFHGHYLDDIVTTGVENRGFRRQLLCFVIGVYPNICLYGAKK